MCQDSKNPTNTTINGSITLDLSNGILYFCTVAGPVIKRSIQKNLFTLENSATLTDHKAFVKHATVIGIMKEGSSKVLCDVLTLVNSYEAFTISEEKKNIIYKNRLQVANTKGDLHSNKGNVARAIKRFIYLVNNVRMLKGWHSFRQRAFFINT